MAENKIYLFGESIARVDNLEDSISSKVYKVGTWKGSSSNALRTNGFKPNTPASSTIVNTAIVQNNLPAYIISNVMVNRAVRNGVADIDLTTDGDVNATANNWISKMGPSGSAIPSFLVDGEVTTQKIALEAVLNNRIANRSSSYAGIESAKIALDTITGGSKVGEGNIAQNTIHTYNIADNAVTTAKIVNLNITTDKLADNAVTTGKILDNNITTSKILNKNVTTDKVNDGAITAIKLATDSVETAKIKNSAVTADKLATDSVTTVKILDSNVTTAKIANKNVTTDKLADTAVTEAKLANNAVYTNSIKDDAVTSAKIADSTIVNANISSTANIESSKIDYSKGISINGWTITATNGGNLVISNGTVNFEFKSNGDLNLT